MAGFITENIPVKVPLVPTDFRHAIAIGETGCGKTSGFILPNLQARITSSYGIFAVDFKGSLGLQIKALAADADRLDDVIEIGVPWGHSFDLMHGVDSMMFSEMLKNSYQEKEVSFWNTAGINIGVKIFELFSTIDLIKELLVDSKLYEELDEYALDVKSFGNVVLSKKTLSKFVEDFQEFNDVISQRMADKRLSMRNKVLIEQYVALTKENLDDLESFASEIESDSPASGNGGVLFSLRSMFMTLDQHLFSGKADIVQWLEAGKIVMTRSDVLDVRITQMFTQYLFKRLMNRLGTQPISLFIDKFQRVVTKESIPFVDVFREKKVELIAAIQNQMQLENKLGENECDEFLANVIHRYTFANQEENNLESFMYLHEGRQRKTEPIFQQDKALYISQYKWQRMNNQVILLKGDWIYLRHERLYKCTVMNIQTKELQSYHLLDDNSMVKLKGKIKKSA